MSIDKAGTGYTLTATGSTVSTTPGVVVSSGFNITPGAIDHYAVSTSPPQAAGTRFTVTVTAQDANNNTVTTDSSTVVTMSGTGSVQFDSNGDGAYGDNTKTLSSGTFTIIARDNVAETTTITASANSKSGFTPVVISPLRAVWLYRKAITIDHTKVSANQTNFPVLINLASDASLAAHARSDGFDLLFTASDGATVLPYEREQYTNTTGALVAWVKVPILSSAADTVLYLYYGDGRRDGPAGPRPASGIPITGAYGI